MTDAVLGKTRTLHVPRATRDDAVSPYLTTPLPHLSSLDRALLRGVLRAARSRIASANGLQHIACECDPFILVLNHSTRLEALTVPALLVAARGGRRLPFLADWNFRLIPGLGLLYKRAHAVSITRKPAKPRVLNALKPLYRGELSAWEEAELLLRSGSSIALFPEGTVNRDPNHLLKGRVGAAYLSQLTGVPVIPAGLRFPEVPEGTPVPEGSALALTIGAPLDIPKSASLKARHAQIMSAISLQSGKSWPPKAGEMR